MSAYRGMDEDPTSSGKREHVGETLAYPRPSVPGSCRYNLVLDLDLTLVYTCPVKAVCGSPQLLKQVKSMEKIWMCNGTLVSFFRPNVRASIAHLSQYFNIYVHTHGIKQYAERLVDALGIDKFCCGIKSRDTLASPVIEKSLLDLSLTGHDTFVVDDRTSVWRKEDRGVCIQVPPFQGCAEDTVMVRLASLMVQWTKSAARPHQSEVARAAAAWSSILSRPHEKQDITAAPLFPPTVQNVGSSSKLQQIRRSSSQEDQGNKESKLTYRLMATKQLGSKLRFPSLQPPPLTPVRDTTNLYDRNLKYP
eukprot:ANDGO_05288.mRNA.1 hypothetical protein